MKAKSSGVNILFARVKTEWDGKEFLDVHEAKGYIAVSFIAVLANKPARWYSWIKEPAEVNVAKIMLKAMERDLDGESLPLVFSPTIPQKVMLDAAIAAGVRVNFSMLPEVDPDTLSGQQLADLPPIPDDYQPTPFERYVLAGVNLANEGIEIAHGAISAHFDLIGAMGKAMDYQGDQFLDLKNSVQSLLRQHEVFIHGFPQSTGFYLLKVNGKDGATENITIVEVVDGKEPGSRHLHMIGDAAPYSPDEFTNDDFIPVGFPSNWIRSFIATQRAKINAVETDLEDAHNG